MSGRTRQAFGAFGRGVRELLRLRWVKVLVVLVALALGVRFGGVWLLGRTARSLARDVGLECSWDALDLSLHSGRGEVRYLSFVPVDDSGEPTAEPLVELEYAVFDLDVRALFSGRISIRRAEVDGLDTRLEREPDGTWNLERHVDVARLLSPPEEEEAEEENAADDDAASGELRLAPPIALAAMRIQHARLHLVDHAVEPALDEVLEANVRLSNVGFEDRRVRFTATVTGGELIDGATLDGEATWTASELALDLTAHAGSFRPGPLAPYLALAWVEPRAESIEASGRVALELHVDGEARDGLRGRLELSELELVADGRSELALRRATIELERGSAERATLPRIAVEGVRGAAALESTGALAVGGFALLAAPPAADAPQGPDTPAEVGLLFDLAGAPRWAALFARADADAYPWEVGEIVAGDVELELQDRSVAPAAELVLAVDSFALGPLVHDPALERAPVPVEVRMRAPGVAESIRVDGTLAPFAPRRGADLTLVVEGIGLEALEPYLDRAGVAETLDAGTFHAHLVAEFETDADGRTVGEVELEELALRGEEELFGLRSMAAREIVVDPAQGLVRLGDLELAGPHLFVARAPSSGILAFGLQLGRTGAKSVEAAANGGDAGASSPTAQAPTGAGTGTGAKAAAPLPRIEIGRLAWVDTDIAFVDDAVDPPSRLAVDELGFELLNLSLGGPPAAAGAPDPEPATFRARFVASELAEELVVEGTILSKPGPVDLAARLSARGDGLRGRLLVPYLRELGLEPALESGSVRGTLEATLRETDGAWRAGLSLEDVSLADAGIPLVGVRGVEVEDVVLADDGVTVGRIAVDGPFARVAREASGALRAAGLRVLPPAEDDGATAEPVPDDAAPAPLALPELPAVRLAALELRDARLEWSDAAAPGASDAAPVELGLALDLDLERIDLSGAERGTFRAELGAAGVVESLSVEGTLSLDPAQWTVEAGVAGTGLTGEALVPYLPPGVVPPSEPCLFQARGAAKVGPHAEGGVVVSLGASEVGYFVGRTEEPALAIAEAAAFVGRLDPAAGRVTIDAVRTDGVELHVAREANGAVRALGFTLDPSVAPVEPPATEEPTPDAQTTIAARPTPPPRVEIAGGLDVGVDRLVFTDASLGEGARPIEASFGLRLDGPAVLLDADPRELAPVRLELDAALADVLRANVGVEAAPFADPATVRVELDARDVRTQGLVELMPSLASALAGEVEQGAAHATLAVELEVRRSAPYDLGLQRAFGLDVRLEGADYLDAPNGRSYAGVDELLVEGRIDPARGLVHLKTVEVRNPHGFARRDAEGLHALGFVVAAPAEATGEEAAADTSGAGRERGGVEVRAVEAAAPRDGATVSPAAGEVRIDELLVSGIDFELVDETGTPALVVPLTGLDAELKRFTTRMLEEPRPVGFSAYLTSTPKDGTAPVFGEVSLSGRLALAPEPRGWAQVGLEGLELVPFAGLAANEDLTIEDGALDANVRVRVRDASSAKVNASFVFTDLDVAEPDGGPISRVLSLPASLDAVLFLLRNQDGEHRMSVGFPVDEDGVSLGSIATAAAGAMAEVIARAVAAAPMRVVGGVLPLGGMLPLSGVLPFGGGEEPETSWTFELDPGALDPDRFAGDEDALADAFAKVARRLNARGSFIATLRHETAQGDWERAAELANPGADECLELSAGLRQHKAELLRAIDELATEARTLFAIGREGQGERASEELRELERRLLETEQGLDHVLGILRRDSQRQQDKRTRAAARELAEERLERLRGELAGWIAKDALERIELRSPRGRVVEGLERSRIVLELRRR